MAKILVVLLCIAAASAKNLADKPAPILNKSTEDLTVEVSTIDNIESYKARHPDITVTPLEFVQNNNVNYYYVGGRVAGDSLVATASDSASWSSLQNVQVLIQYPRSGLGAIITYVSLTVSHSSNVGDAYIVSGGYGMRSIALVIEARSTSYINYSAEIYGI